MSSFDFKVSTIQLDLVSERKQVENFLATQQLKLDLDVTHTLVVKSGKTIVGTGSLASNVIKCVAVHPEYQGENLTNKIISELEFEAYHRGIEHLFLFTKNKNRNVFESLGFGTVAAPETFPKEENIIERTASGGKTPGKNHPSVNTLSEEERDAIVLLEKPEGNVDEWMKRLAAKASARPQEPARPLEPRRSLESEQSLETGRAIEPEQHLVTPASSLVMNCNPFTLGHRYLVEQASRRAEEKGELVHLFVVSAERSLFPQEVRFQLVKQGTAEFKNVVVHHGGPYIISGATFPSYFLRDSKEVTTAHARLDLQIFGERIAPALNICKRMVGEEPYCPVTAAYNREMQVVLPMYGIEVEVIPRLTFQGTAVSASKVRELIRNDGWAGIKQMVPSTTWEYLHSPEAVSVIERIKREKRRH